MAALAAPSHSLAPSGRRCEPIFRGGRVTSIHDISIADLRRDLNGKVIASDDPAYDEARPAFFTRFDRRPAAILRVADAADVARLGDLGRETGVRLAVRSGGHSAAGYGTSEHGIV